MFVYGVQISYWHLVYNIHKMCTSRQPVTRKMFPFDDVIMSPSSMNVHDRVSTLQWRHNECYGVSNHQPHDCLLNCLFNANQRKHQSSASLAFVRGIHRSPVNSPHKWPVTRKMFPFDDVIMKTDPTHGGPSEAGDCSHPPPKMATAENPTSEKGTFDNVMGCRSLRFVACE